VHGVLYLIRRFPGELANETIDLMLVSGVFEQPTSVIFMGDGVWQLVGDGSKIDRKDTARALNALPMYDVESLYVDETSLAERGIAFENIDLPVQAISPSEVTRLLHDHDVVIGD
jgi:tRNA 2-thiouridine synthesizing protein C